MTHTVTGKLNADANTYPNQSGTTFFVRLGESNFNFKTKTKEWTNYEAAIFVKENQVSFYQDALVAGAIVSVTGKGLLVENDAQYGVKLHIQDPKIVYAHNPTLAPPQQQAPQQQYQPPQQRQAPAPQQQAPQQQYQAPHQGSAPPPLMDDFSEDIPF